MAPPTSPYRLTKPWRPSFFPQTSCSLQENLARKLCDSVERLQRQMEAGEVWASAVRGLVAPVPDYQPDDAAIARYVKPGRPPRKRRRRVTRRTKAQGTKRALA